MATLDEFQQSTLRQATGNRVLGRPTLAINGASAATVASAAFPFSIDGRVFNRAALSAQALAVNAALQQKITYQSTFYVQPISTTVYYTLVLNAANTVSTIQGTWSGQTFSGASIPIGRGEIPDPDDLLFVPFGGIKVVTNASTTFTPGTTALDAAGLTVTYSDYAGVIPGTAW